LNLKTAMTRFARRVRQALAVETLIVDPGFHEAAAPRERETWDREELQRQALEAWRHNPLARRIVSLTTQYVLGGGIQLRSPNPRVHAFLQAWWHHPLNACPLRAVEWCDVLTRSGEIFFLLSTDAAGMSYVRAVPALQVAEIQTSAGDTAQETGYSFKPVQAAGWDDSPWLGERTYPADGLESGTGGAPPPAVRHYAVNRPVGAVHGESDLAPMLRWLVRYTSWLEDRARLNRYRNSFYFVVKGNFASEAERRTRQALLNTNPPTPGSILVADASEAWEVISPQLESHEAAADGLALKKMIAAGAGIPLHFLAEPESSTRTTAESAGEPAMRFFAQRQAFFLQMVADLARAAVRRYGCVNQRLDVSAPVEVLGTDLSSRDNAALAGAAGAVLDSWLALYDRGLVDATELLRMAYRFAGEAVDLDDLLRRAQRKPNPTSQGGDV